ncbi:hypothetical protein LguiB_033470 [Lonicera macranthoides]
MEDPTRNLQSRKAEEAASRRSQATQWLDSLVGPLGIPNQPTEREFISCLRNGLILCNAINKIQPGSVPKVVENHSTSESLIWDSQPLPAYQYFENVRNFLVAVGELKLQAFDASIFERDNLDAGSSAKVVDCILELRAYHEWKKMSGGNGFYKPQRSPLVAYSAARVHSQASEATFFEPQRRLDMSTGFDTKQPPSDSENQKLEDSIVNALAESMVEAKENIDDNLIASFHNGNLNAAKLLSRILSSCLDEQFQNKSLEDKPILKDILGEGSNSLVHSTCTSPEDSSIIKNQKYCRACLKKGHCNHWQLFEVQEKELLNLKSLLSCTKKEFGDLQSQLQNDLRQLGDQVEEMSAAALGYHKVVKENMNLYNMVQDLKGNIRVYCRIRPAFNVEATKVIDFTGEDGSLVALDPLKSQKDGKRFFRFDHVFGPTATQDEVFRDIEPIIRSVMDGYNVCIFTYGQTGSGKTYTMCGPTGGSTKELGINYQALDYLFQLSNKRKDIINYEIYVQMVEIYNEQMRDLLAEDSSTTKYPLEIPSCNSENGSILHEATMHSVKFSSDVINLMKLGEVNRVVRSTAINDRSSRSHSILTVHVHGEDTSGNILRSCLHLVDLAGSERVDKSEVTEDGLKEAQYINKSLSCLGDVITALAQKNSYIPYRNSKLTLLLQNSLGGHAKTLMFAHLSPEADSFVETMATLKFAQRVSTIELGAPRLNKESSEAIELKEQIDSLKKALAKREAQSAQTNKPRETKSPFDKPKATPERTPPPRSRRLSIENCNSTKTEKVQSSELKKGSKTPSVPARSRRLSLEGPRNKDPVKYKIPEPTTKPMHLGQSVTDTCRQRAPRSPTGSVHKSQVVKTDVRTMKTPPPKLHKTPERSVPGRNDAGLMSSTKERGSQIKKSLRSIGKLINGSEKRNQHKLAEVSSPFNVTSSIYEGKSPALPPSARELRRQSLTGIQTTRRSSLGGNSNDLCANEARNAKTPPPVHGSAKAMKRWL